MSLVLPRGWLILFYTKITPKYWITLEISELEKILV